jgi:hypothetical protein
MAWKPIARIPMDESADPKQRFDRLLTGWLTVKKTELEEIEPKLNAVQKETQRRKSQETEK